MSKKDLQKVIKDIIIKYKDIIFSLYSTICIKSLDKVNKQQVTNDKAYDQNLKDDAMKKLTWN